MLDGLTSRRSCRIETSVHLEVLPLDSFLMDSFVFRKKLGELAILKGDFHISRSKFLKLYENQVAAAPGFKKQFHVLNELSSKAKRAGELLLKLYSYEGKERDWELEAVIRDLGSLVEVNKKKLLNNSEKTKKLFDAASNQFSHSVTKIEWILSVGNQNNIKHCSIDREVFLTEFREKKEMIVSIFKKNRTPFSEMILKLFEQVELFTKSVEEIFVKAVGIGDSPKGWERTRANISLHGLEVGTKRSYRVFERVSIKLSFFPYEEVAYINSKVVRCSKEKVAFEFELLGHAESRALEKKLNEAEIYRCLKGLKGAM